MIKKANKPASVRLVSAWKRDAQTGRDGTSVYCRDVRGNV